jgi:hypothetical protein
MNIKGKTTLLVFASILFLSLAKTAFSYPAIGQQKDWTYAGRDGDKVTIPSADVSKVTIVAYGVADQWTYTFIKGLSKIDCSHENFRDVAFGLNKYCYITSDKNILKMFTFPEDTSTTNWVNCAKNTQESCTVGVPGITWIKYVSDKSSNGKEAYVYALTSSYSVNKTPITQTLPCNNGPFGVDPAPGENKQCYYYNAPFADTPRFAISVAQNNTTTWGPPGIVNSRYALVQYGYKVGDLPVLNDQTNRIDIVGMWYYKPMSGTSVLCSDDTLGSPGQKDEKKACRVAFPLLNTNP